MNGLRLGITAVAGAGIIAHLLWPRIAIDAVTLALMGIAIIPWLEKLFKAVELPGGLKIEFRDLERIQEQASKAGLIEARPLQVGRQTYSFELVAHEDPNLALAGLRIEIERRLRQLAETRQLPQVSSTGVSQIIRSLDDADLLRPAEQATLSDMIRLLNQAVHGANVDARAASWALEVGPMLLSSLDRRINEASSGRVG